MPRALVLYATTHGHSAKIASRLAEALGRDGVQPEVREIKAAGDADPRDYDAVTGWAPGVTFAVAGALQYREYDVFTRLLMCLKMRQGGHETDTAQDHEYTDWDAVERFAADFATQLADR